MHHRTVDGPSGLRERFIGGILWTVVALLVVIGLRDASVKLGGMQRMVSLGNYWLGRDPLLRLRAVPGLVAIGDPVFYRRGDGRWIQVGYIESVALVQAADAADSRGRYAAVSLRWHDQRVDPWASHLVAYQNRGTMTEMVQVMFPEEKRTAIRQLLAEAMRQHGDALADRFLPLVEQSMRRSLPVMEAEFVASLDRHRDEIRQLGDRWKEEILRERLLPLVKEQLLPIAQLHAEPTIRAIGRELWNRASLWSFTWRAAYDRTRLPRRDLMREEWERFMRDEAMPVIQAHSDDLAVAFQRTLADVMRSPVVREELAAAAALLASDHQTRELIGAVLRETLVENEPMRRVWVEVWTSDDAEAAYDDASDLLGPLVHRIGEEMLGSPQRGIDPGLARLLRHQVLGKDRRWVVAHPSSGQELPEGERQISRGTGAPIYPLLYLAGESTDE